LFVEVQVVVVIEVSVTSNDVCQAF
jgi:hypothetical protein